MIGLVVAWVFAAPAPLSVCVHGRSIDPTALHDALRIEAKKVGREAIVSLAQSRAICRSIAPEVVVSLGDVAVVSAGDRRVDVDLRRLSPDERVVELARVALAEVAPSSDATPLVEDALTPLPLPSEQVWVRPTPRRERPTSPSRAFAGLGFASRGDRWMPELELGGWVPLGASGLALGLRFAHLPEHEVVEAAVAIERLELAAHVLLEARVTLDRRLGLAFQIGGGVVWRRAELVEDVLTEVVGSGIGALELRWDVAAPLYLALALQGTVYSGGHDYQTFVEARVTPAPTAPRGAFGGVLRVGARW